MTALEALQELESRRFLAFAIIMANDANDRDVESISIGCYDCGKYDINYY